MEQIKHRSENGHTVICLSGRIDSSNSEAVENELLTVIAEHCGGDPVFDTADL